MKDLIQGFLGIALGMASIIFWTWFLLKVFEVVFS